MDARKPGGLLPMDLAALGYLGTVAALVVIFRHRVPDWPWFAAAHLGLAGGVGLLGRWNGRLEPAALRLVRFWYPLFLVPLVFKLNGRLVPRISPVDLDLKLLAWDRVLFGRHPAAHLAGLESPWVTAILRLCWMSYFVLPFLVAIPIYRRAMRPGQDRTPLDVTVFALTAGWYLSYLGYFVTPAIGPGYHAALVGSPPARSLGVTEAMLGTLWALEGDTVHDVCPSGHVIIAGLSAWLAFRYRLAVRWWLVPVVAGLVIGTVYLRFHYGVDVVAGLVVVLAVALAAPWLHRRAPEERHAV